MAKASIEGNIPGIGNITVTGNIATEDAIQDLIKAVQGQAASQKINTRDMQDNLDDTSDSLDEFSDEIDSAIRSQNKLNKRMIDLTEKTEDMSKGFVSALRNTDSVRDMVESTGGILAGFAGGLAGMIPIVGEGTARLAEATVMAGTALLGMAVGAVESFQAMNRTIMDGGLILQGGFSGLANAADIAGIPVNEFGNAVMANIHRLRLLEGGAPGGLRRLSDGFRVLQEAQNENLDTLYALGFSQQEVVTGMSNVALGAQRAGRNLSSEELAAGTFDYLKNLRELSRLTGESAESIQQQVDANRANLFVQNALLDVAPEQRAASEAFAASIPAALGPIRDFIVTGQSFTAESGVMVSEMSTFADIYRNAYESVATGAMTAEQAQDYLATTLQTNAGTIESELNRMTRAFGVAPDQPYADALGAAQLAARQMIMAGESADALGSAGDGGENLSITIGALQGASEAARAAIQSTFIEGLDALSGDTGALTRFAQMISGAAMGAEAFRDAMLHVMRGDLAAAARSFVPDGYTPDSRTLDPREYQDPLELLPGYDPNMLPGAATGGVLTGPESGYTAELHGTEAVVPLPDGRNIPVSINSDYTNEAFANLSFERLSNGLDQLSDLMQTNNTLKEEQVEPLRIEDFSNSLDSSRTLTEMLQVNKNMLSQLVSNVQKTDFLIRAMNESNAISRSSAMARA